MQLPSCCRPSLAAAASNCHPHLHRPQVYLHAADRQWVTRPSPRLEFWEGDERQLGPGLRLLHLGGHFPGSCVLLWKAARDGKGAMFTGEGRIGVERKAPGAQLCLCQGHSNVQFEQVLVHSFGLLGQPTFSLHHPNRIPATDPFQVTRCSRCPVAE